MFKHVYRTHVDKDLQPYVCISEDCAEPFQLFICRQSWMDHMRTQHSVDRSKQIHTDKWFCDVKHKEGPPEFDTVADFLNHLNACHGHELSQSRIMGRLRRNRRLATSGNAFACPLCNCIMSDIEDRGIKKAYEYLWKHISRHLNSLAFLSLSYIEDLEVRDSIANFSESKQQRRYESTCALI
jgi:hypothetical protein